MGLFRKREATTPELVEIPPISDLPKSKLQSPARYLGTLNAAGEKVVALSLSARSTSRLHLSTEALDVVRMAGSFRIPVSAMLGATTAPEFGGKPVEKLLVVRWKHGGQEWQTGFRLEASRNIKSGASAPHLDQWVRTISKLSRVTGGGR